jgi:hypothetical protein
LQDSWQTAERGTQQRNRGAVLHWEGHGKEIGVLCCRCTDVQQREIHMDPRGSLNGLSCLEPAGVYSNTCTLACLLPRTHLCLPCVCYLALHALCLLPRSWHCPYKTML